MPDDKLNDLIRELMKREMLNQSPPALLRHSPPEPQTKPRTFMGFSSTDRWCFTQMLRWNADENIDVCLCRLST
jgi:hypothetical protein